MKDYGHMFRNDPALADKAAHISAMTKDVTELMTEIGFAPSGDAPKLRVAYHSACSLQHGQKISQEPVALLAALASTSSPFRRVTSAAVRREPIMCCSRRWPMSCGREKSPISRASRRTLSLRATSAASFRSGRERPSQSSTQWNCSTGRAAGRSLQRSIAEKLEELSSDVTACIIPDAREASDRGIR